MPTATMALRPSSAISVGNPTVNPSTERPTSWAAPSGTDPACRPARSRIVVSGTPCHTAVPTRSPPTSFETQAIVTGASIIGKANSSSKVRR